MALCLLFACTPLRAQNSAAQFCANSTASLAKDHNDENQKKLTRLEEAGPLADPPTPTGRATLAELAKGQPLTDSFLKIRHGIPAAFLPYIDRATGDFTYRAASPFSLLRDNGRDPVAAIQMNFVEVPDPASPFNREPEALLRDYANVLTALPWLKLWVTGRPETLPRLEVLKATFPKQVSGRMQGVPLLNRLVNRWMQDGSLAGKENEWILPAWGNTADETHYSPLAASQKAGLVSLGQSLFPFEGGDVVVGDRHLFTGSTNLEDLTARIRAPRSKIYAAMASEFGKPIFEVGAPTQAGGEWESITFHVDLNLAAAVDQRTDEEVILLDSPRSVFEDALGLPPLETLSAREFAQHLANVQQRMHRRYHPGAPTSALTTQERRFLSYLPKLRLSDVMLRIKQNAFVQARLEHEGYRVEALPGITNLLRSREKNIFGYANSFFIKDYVLAPRLDIRFLDGPAYQVFRRLGYTVLPMASAPKYFVADGGPRCAGHLCGRAKKMTTPR